MDGILTPEQLQALEAQANLQQQDAQRRAMLSNLERDAALIAKYSDLARRESKSPWYLPKYDDMGNENVVPVPPSVRLEYAQKAAELDREMNRKIFPVQPNPLNVPSQAQEQPTPTPAPAAPEAAPAREQEKPQYDPFAQFSELMRQRDDFRAKAFQYAKQTLPREDWLDAMNIADKYVSERFKAPQNIAQPIIDQFTGKPLEGFALIGGKVEKIEKSKVASELTVPGYQGEAPTQAEAVAFRRKVSAANSGNADLDQLIELAKKGSSLSPNDRARASNLATMVGAKFRRDIVGEGAITEGDRAIIEKVVPNPLQMFSLVNFPELLQDMKNRLNASVAADAAILGLKPTGQPSQPSQGGGGVSRMRFDTSGKRIQ